MARISALSVEELNRRCKNIKMRNFSNRNSWLIFYFGVSFSSASAVRSFVRSFSFSIYVCHSPPQLSHMQKSLRDVLLFFFCSRFIRKLLCCCEDSPEMQSIAFYLFDKACAKASEWAQPNCSNWLKCWTTNRPNYQKQRERKKWRAAHVCAVCSFVFILSISAILCENSSSCSQEIMTQNRILQQHTYICDKFLQIQKWIKNQVEIFSRILLHVWAFV